MNAHTPAFARTLAAPAQTAGQSPASDAPLQTIARLDVARYMGTWYEIAKVPNRFQRHCAADTQALYRQREDGQLDVINSCRQANGERTEAIGRARQLGAADSPGWKCASPLPGCPWSGATTGSSTSTPPINWWP